MPGLPRGLRDYFGNESPLLLCLYPLEGKYGAQYRITEHNSKLCAGKRLSELNLTSVILHRKLQVDRVRCNDDVGRCKDKVSLPTDVEEYMAEPPSEKSEEVCWIARFHERCCFPSTHIAEPFPKKSNAISSMERKPFHFMHICRSVL